VIISPSLPNAQSSTSSPTSSERRNAPANPGRINARSRTPISPASVTSTIARMSSVSVGAFCVAAVPRVRRIPGGEQCPPPFALYWADNLSGGRHAATSPSVCSITFVRRWRCRTQWRTPCGSLGVGFKPQQLEGFCVHPENRLPILSLGGLRPSESNRSGYAGCGSVSAFGDSLWFGNDTAGTDFHTDLAGTTLGTLAIESTGVAWDGTNLYFGHAF